MTIQPNQLGEISENTSLAFIIEDDVHLATIFAAALQEAEYKTKIIGDGAQALKQLMVTVPALVVLDLHLPKVAGKDILQQIRSDARLIKTQVILTTADALQAEMLREKANLVLLKPIGFQQLSDLAARLHPSDPPK